MDCNSKLVWCRIKGDFYWKNQKKHGWFHTALIQRSAHWECEGVTGTGIKLQDCCSSTLYCGQLTCWWMTSKKCEKEISHRQELAGVQFSCSVSNGFLIRVKPSQWAASQIEISFSIWRNVHPLFQQIYGRPVPGLLFLRVAPKACAPLRLDNTTHLTDQRWAGENKGPELSQAALALPSNSAPFSAKTAVINATASNTSHKSWWQGQESVFSSHKRKKQLKNIGF